MTQGPIVAGHRRRLRQRFEKDGFRGFAPHEVLELLLTLAIPRKDTKLPAKLLLTRYGSLKAVLDAPSHELSGVPGIGEVAPTALRVIREAAHLYLEQEAEESVDRDGLAALWRSRFGGLRSEVFEIAFLDSAGRLLREGIERLEEGTVDRATVYPRSVMEAALRRGAAGLVVAHNHPNGDPRPSEPDKVLTRALTLAGETVGVRVIDHVIVGAKGIFSFKEEGLL